MVSLRLVVLIGLLALTSVGCFRLNAAGEVELTDFGMLYADSIRFHHSTTCTTWCGKHRCTSTCYGY